MLGKGLIPCLKDSQERALPKGVEALEANEVSEDELETEYQEAMAVLTVVKPRKAGKPPSSGDHKVELDTLAQKLPCVQRRQMGYWKDGHHCLAKVKRVNWAGGSSKCVGELGTVGCASRSCKRVNLKPLCGSNESLSHNFGRENSTCGGYVFYVPNMGGSVVRDCGDTRPASGTLGYVLGVEDTKQTFFCQPEDMRSGAQPVCEPLPLTAPNIGSESVVDVCSDRAEEGSCLVSGARGPPIEGDPSVWTCKTNDYLIDDWLTTGEPQACANLGLGGSVRSELDGSEGIAPTDEGGDFGDNGVGEGASGAEMSTCGWNENTTTQDLQSSYAHLGVQSRLCLEANSRVTASTTRTGHLDGDTSADVGWQAVPRLCHDDRVAVFCQHPRPEKAGRARSYELDC